MADNLSLRVHLDTSQADKALSSLYAKMKTLDKASSALSKSITNTGTASKLASTNLQTFAKTSAQANREMQVLGRVSNATGGILRNGFHNAWIGAGRLLRTTSMLAGVIGGLSVGKIASEYVSFSRQVGVMNATLRASPETVRKLESSILSISARSAQTPETVTKGLTQIFSNPELDPTKQGRIKEGSDEYVKNVQNIVSMTDILSKAAAAHGVSAEEMTNGVLNMAGGFDLSLKSGQDMTYVLDKLNNVLAVSKGEMGPIVESVGTYAKTLKDAGLSMDESFALMAVMTKSFSPDEAAHRAQSFGKILLDSNDAIQRTRNKMKNFGIKEDIGKLFYKTDPKNKTVVLKSHMELMNGVSQMLNKYEGRADIQNALMSALFPEIKGAQAFRQLRDQIQTYNDALQGMGREGATKESIAGSMVAPGKQLDRIFSSLNGSLLITASSLIRVVTNFDKLSSVDFSDIDSSIESIATGLDEDLGPGIGNVVREFGKLNKWLRSSEGQAWILRTEKGLENIKNIIFAISDGIGRIASSDLFKSLADFATSNPLAAVGLALFGPAAIKAAIGGVVRTAFAGAGGVLAGSIASGGVAAGIASSVAAGFALISWAALVAGLGLAITETVKFGIDQAKNVMAENDKTVAQGQEFTKTANAKADAAAVFASRFSDKDPQKKVANLKAAYEREQAAAQASAGEYDRVGSVPIQALMHNVTAMLGAKPENDPVTGGLYKEMTAHQEKADRLFTEYRNANKMLPAEQRNLYNKRESVYVGGVNKTLTGGEVLPPPPPGLMARVTQGVNYVRSRGVGGVMQDIAKGAPDALAGVATQLTAAAQAGRDAQIKGANDAQGALVNAANKMVSIIQAGVSNLSVSGAGGGGSTGGHSPNGNSSSLYDKFRSLF